MNPELQYLKCYNNQITSLDLSKNAKLTNIHCDENISVEFAKSVDDSNDSETGEITIFFDGCSEDWPMLVKLEIGYDDSEGFTVDWGDDSPVENKKFNGGQLELQNGLKVVTIEKEYDGSVESAQITLSGCLKSLQWVGQSRSTLNNFDGIDTSNCPALTKLVVCGCDKRNNLSQLDLSNNSELKHLDCSWNRMQDLDLSNLEKLEWVAFGLNDDLDYACVLETLHENDLGSTKCVEGSGFNLDDEDDEYTNELKEIVERKGWEWEW